jgi:DeoR family fructose operon transcriptional repressor
MHLLKKWNLHAREARWKRWRIIFDMLEDRHVVPIKEIVTATGAKPSTIEKDIQTLSERGLARKTLKGGLALEKYHAEKSLEERSTEDQSAKAEIARLASAKYIENGMNLFLDGSTSVQAIVPYIVGMDLKIITNSLSIISELRKHLFKGEIECPGGTYRGKSNNLVGEKTVEYLVSCKADLAILGVEGISKKLELMESHPDEALLKQAMMEHADRTIVLAMPHKFNEDALLAFANLGQVEALISTRFTDPDFKQKARESGVRLECPASAQS